MYYCYRCIRLDRNEPFYIGVGIKPITLRQDKAPSYRQEYPRAFARKKGNAEWSHIVDTVPFKVDIVYECDNRDEILLKEKEFIAIYGRRDIGSGTLINHTKGGEMTIGRRIPWNKGRTGVYSEESLKRITEANRENGVKKISKRVPKVVVPYIRTGRKQSKESLLKREATRIANGNNVRSAEHRRKVGESNFKPVLQCSIDGEVIAEWPSAKGAQDSLKVSNISACIRGKQKSAGGYLWKFKHSQ